MHSLMNSQARDTRDSRWMTTMFWKSANRVSGVHLTTVPEHEWGVWIRRLLAGLSFYYYYFPVEGYRTIDNNRKNLRLYCWRYRRFHNYLLVFFIKKKMPNSNIRQTIPEIAKKLSGSLRGQRVSQSALKAAQSKRTGNLKTNQKDRRRQALIKFATLYLKTDMTQSGTSMACTASLMK